MSAGDLLEIEILDFIQTGMPIVDSDAVPQVSNQRQEQLGIEEILCVGQRAAWYTRGSVKSAYPWEVE